MNNLLIFFLGYGIALTSVAPDNWTKAFGLLLLIPPTIVLLVQNWNVDLRTIREKRK